MRKLIAAINMTLDGFCNHTAVIADDALHEHVNELMQTTDTLLFGRITYQLMEQSWPPMVTHPIGNKAVDTFAVLIDNASKVVFSHTLSAVTWKHARLAGNSLEKEVMQMKQQSGKDILVGSPSLISQLTRLDLIDEYQLSLQPIILGNGLPLFKDITERKNLKFRQTKILESGVIVLYYEKQ